MKDTILTDDSVIVVETTTTTRKRRVSWDDIQTRVEFDEHSTESPWDDCDGWEHDFELDQGASPAERDNAIGRVNRPYRNGGSGWITIDDETLIGWGHSRKPGESAQVWRERVAQIKRAAIEQLVEWYENGWQWYGAVASYGEYDASVWGIDSEDYARELAETELREEIADSMEAEGHIITDRPARKTWTAVDRMRDQIKRQLVA